MSSYEALQNLLPKSHGIFKSFKPIKDEDLKMSSDITEEKRYNQRNDRIAWFWHVHQGGKKNTHEWMCEC